MAELATQLTSNHNRSFQRILTDYEISITRVILFCVSELPFPMGARKISYILKGSKSTFNIEYELYELETFSVLSPYSAKQLTEMIDILVSTELLKTESAVDYTDMPVISLTNKGRAYLSGKVESPVVILDSIIDTEVIYPVRYDLADWCQSIIWKLRVIKDFNSCSYWSIFSKKE